MAMLWVFPDHNAVALFGSACVRVRSLICVCARARVSNYPIQRVCAWMGYCLVGDYQSLNLIIPSPFGRKARLASDLRVLFNLPFFFGFGLFAQLSPLLVPVAGRNCLIILTSLTFLNSLLNPFRFSIIILDYVSFNPWRPQCSAPC